MGVWQITILLHKSYLVKVFLKGEGVKSPENLSTWYMVLINIFQKLMGQLDFRDDPIPSLLGLNPLKAYAHVLGVIKVGLLCLGVFKANPD